MGWEEKRDRKRILKDCEIEHIGRANGVGGGKKELESFVMSPSDAIIPDVEERKMEEVAR